MNVNERICFEIIHLIKISWTIHIILAGRGDRYALEL